MGQLGKIGSMGPYLVRPRVLEHVVPVHVRIGVEEVARQVPVVIRTRILRVIPVQGSVAVLAEPVQDGRAPLEPVGRREVVFEDGDGLVGLADPGVTDPPVLVAPVGIVHVVPHQVIDLLGGSVLRTALARRGKEDHAQLMGVVEDLVGGQIIRKGTVIHPVDPVVAAQPGGHIGRERPAVVHQARRIGPHEAEPVQGAIGKHAPTQALPDVGRIAENVGQAVVAAESEVGHLGAVHRLLGAHGLVEAAPERERRVAGNGVVHLDTGQIHVLRLRAVTAGPETDGAEVVAGDVVEHVVGSEQDGGIVVVAAVLQVERREGVLIQFDDPLDTGQGEVEHVLHVAVVHGHLHLGFQVLGGVDHERVHAVGQVLDQEGSVFGGNRRGDFRSALQQGETGIFHGLPPIPVHDRTLHTATVLLGEKEDGGGQGGHRQE